MLGLWGLPAWPACLHPRPHLRLGVFEAAPTQIATSPETETARRIDATGPGLRSGRMVSWWMGGWVGWRGGFGWLVGWADVVLPSGVGVGGWWIADSLGHRCRHPGMHVAPPSGHLPRYLKLKAIKMAQPPFSSWLAFPPRTWAQPLPEAPRPPPPLPARPPGADPTPTASPCLRHLDFH